MTDPTVEAVAERIWQDDNLRVTGRLRYVDWSEAGEHAHLVNRSRATAAIEALKALDWKPPQ